MNLANQAVEAVKEHYESIGVAIDDDQTRELASLYALGYAHAYQMFSEAFLFEKNQTDKYMKQAQIMNRGDAGAWQTRLRALVSLGHRIQQILPRGLVEESLEQPIEVETHESKPE